MSSIEEKLNTITEIRESLSQLKNNLKQDQDNIDSQISQMKASWNDNQMAIFNGVYVSKFTFNLVELMSKIDKAIGFLENKYSTLQSHRN